jgi:hypothetical protein
MLKARLNNAFADFGDDMLKIAGIGEFATSWTYNWAAGARPANYEAALQLVAKRGWAFQQHTLSLAEDQFTTGTFEQVNAVTPIRDLRWSIAHVPRIDLASPSTDGCTCRVRRRTADRRSAPSSTAASRRAPARTRPPCRCSIRGSKSTTWSPARTRRVS